VILDEAFILLAGAAGVDGAAGGVSMDRRNKINRQKK